MRAFVARRSAGWSRASAAGWAALLAGTGVLTVASALATGLRDRRPDAALGFTPGDARALARRADNGLREGVPDRAALNSGRSDSLAALSRDPTVPAAWRLLAVTTEDPAETVRLLNLSQALSRRDAPTQLALLEVEVQRDDIAGALRHYDVVARISTAYDPVLFPVLAAAIGDPDIRPMLARKLVDAPMWRRRFLSYVVNAPIAYGVQADIFAALAAQAPLADRDIVVAQAANSAAAGDYASALRFYRLAAPVEAARPIRLAGFDRVGGVPPFDWQVDHNGPIGVVVEGDGAQSRLELRSDRGDGGVAARQLTMLPAGRHVLSAPHGTLDEEGAHGTPYVRVACVAGTVLAEFTPAPGNDRLGGVVSVPAGCPIQWLEIGLRQSAEGDRNNAWVGLVRPAGEPAPPR